METVCRIRKGYRNLGIVSLVFFVLMAAVSSFGVLAETPPDRRTAALCFVAAMTLFWSLWACLGCWMLLAYWRERLQVTHAKVSQQGVLRRAEMDLDGVTSIRWKTVPSGGTLTLRTPTDKLTIHFENFEPVDRLWLIRFFRSRFPDAVQDGWELFCGRIALPLRNHRVQVQPAGEANVVVLTRRRWDWYFVPFILLSAVVGLVTSGVFQQPRMLAAPLLPGLMWIVLRVQTPRQGMVAKRITAEPGLLRFLAFELAWFVVGIAGVVLFKIWKPPMPNALVLGTIAFAAWLGVLLWQAVRLDRARRKRDVANASIAVRRWEEVEGHRD